MSKELFANTVSVQTIHVQKVVTKKGAVWQNIE
jgi:hypothetical protein